MPIVDEFDMNRLDLRSAAMPFSEWPPSPDMNQATNPSPNDRKTSTLSQRRGRAPQPSVMWGGVCQPGGGPPHHLRHDSIRLPALSRATLGGSASKGGSSTTMIMQT